MGPPELRRRLEHRRLPRRADESAERDQGTRTSLTQEEFAERAQDDETGRDFAVNVGTFLRHEFGIRTFGYTSLIVDPPNGQLPALTPAAEAAAARKRARGTFGPGPFDDFEDFSLYDRCITRGVIGSMLPVIYGNGVRITQNPESVAISYEMIHDTRIIPLDGRPRSTIRHPAVDGQRARPLRRRHARRRDARTSPTRRASAATAAACRTRSS